MDSVFDEFDPIAYAGGHEHNLQVIRSTPVQYYLVSGSGVFDHTTPVFTTEGSVYGSDEAGYMRVDALRDGRVRLAVISVDEGGNGQEVYSQWLK